MNLTNDQIACLENLRDRDGTINANDVVEEGRKPSSVLHALFDWDVNRVHARYLLAKAEEIIRSCPRPEVEHEDIERVIPRYRHDPDPQAPIGQYVDVAAASREKNVAILDRLMARIRNLILDAKGHASTSGLENEFYTALGSLVDELGEEKKPPPSIPARRRRGERPQVTT
jgi:hypothetical protein